MSLDIRTLRLIIIAIVVGVAAISALAKARGANPKFWGGVSLLGAVAFPSVVLFLVAYFGQYPSLFNVETPFWLFVSFISWFGLLAVCVRFVVGRRRPNPHARWSCPNCKYLNQHYALICEACGLPFQNSFRTF
jgi:hypothetical protein